MKLGTQYSDEICKCTFCDRTFESDEITDLDSWNCPTCRQYIQIEIPSKQRTVIRKQTNDVEINELILLSGESTGKRILDIKPASKDKTSLAIQGFGTKKLSNDEYQNIVIGGC